MVVILGCPNYRNQVFKEKKDNSKRKKRCLIYAPPCVWHDNSHIIELLSFFFGYEAQRRSIISNFSPPLFFILGPTKGENTAPLLSLSLSLFHPLPPPNKKILQQKMQTPFVLYFPNLQFFFTARHSKKKTKFPIPDYRKIQNMGSFDRIGLLCCVALLPVVLGGEVHVALGKTDDSLAVQWSTEDDAGTSTVYWGHSPDRLVYNATGDTRAFHVDVFRKWQTRVVYMTGLEVGAVYYYKAGDTHNGFSDIFSVRNRKQSPPYYHVLFGDMGSAAAFTLCTACTQHNEVCDAKSCEKNTTVGLVSEVEAADMFLHVGDFAYNLGSDDGKTGKQFFENIEQVAAKVPYMVSHGNHEDAPDSLAHYIERFRSQPVNSEPSEYETLNGKAPNTMYFSWNVGMVHYVSFSTELFHLPVDLYSWKVTKATFLKWFEEDMIKANLPANRAKYPWIIVHGHRPLYSSSDSGADKDVREAMEPLFFKYGVSFSINGHQHNYERSFPVYRDKVELSNVNPNATIYIVSGCAGSKEMHTPFTKDQPSWSAFRSNTFGYTRMYVHNSSHIHFQQVRTDPTFFPLSGYGDIIDDVWIVQEHQGGFLEEKAPTKRVAACPEGVCESHDHFAPILSPMLGEADVTKPLHKVIQNYRAKYGEHAWASKLSELLAKVNQQGDQLKHTVKNDAVWEDGLLDAKERSALQWIDSNGQ